jgi:ankyrin repeat protein
MRALRKLLDEGTDPNALRVEGGESPLSLAVATGWRQGVRLLLQAGADPSLPADRFESARAFAAAQGDSALVDLFEEDLYPGSVDTICGRVPLADTVLGWHLFNAVQRGDTKCAKAMLEAGAKPHWKDFRGWTAVHEASYRGNIELLRLLLGNGGDAVTASRWGLTPMHWAGHKGMVEYFRDLRLNANGKEPNLLEDDYDEATTKVTEVMQLLLAAGASPDVGSKYDGTLLMAAIANDDIDRIRLLDRYGANWYAGSERKKLLDVLGPNNSFATYRYILTESRLTQRLDSGQIVGDAAYTVMRQAIKTALRRDDIMQLGALVGELPLAPELRRLSAMTLLQHLAPDTAPPSRGYIRAGPTGPEALATIERTLASPERQFAFALAMEQLQDAQRIGIGRSRTLIAAVTANNLLAARLLLENGLADPDHRDDCRNHAIDIADARGFVEMAALLRRHGATGTGNYQECAS